MEPCTLSHSFLCKNIFWGELSGCEKQVSLTKGSNSKGRRVVWEPWKHPVQMISIYLYREMKHSRRTTPRRSEWRAIVFPLHLIRNIPLQHCRKIRFHYCIILLNTELAAREKGGNVDSRDTEEGRRVLGQQCVPFWPFPNREEKLKSPQEWQKSREHELNKLQANAVFPHSCDYKNQEDKHVEETLWDENQNF